MAYRKLLPVILLILLSCKKETAPCRPYFITTKISIPSNLKVIGEVDGFVLLAPKNIYIDSCNGGIHL